MERARERAASIAILTAIPMVAQVVAGRAVRDTLFLTQYDASYLPRVMLAASILSLGFAALVARWMPRWGPRAAALMLSIANGAAFVLEAALVDDAPRGVAVATYLHVSVAGALVVSAFSSVVNERFDPLYAKTVVARVGMAATVGGVLGGAVALVLASPVDLATVLNGLGAISAVVAMGVWRIGRSTQPQRPDDGPARSGVETIRDDPYLSRIALTVILLGAVGVFADYAMKAEADARFGDAASLLSFFSVFYRVTARRTVVMSLVTSMLPTMNSGNSVGCETTYSKRSAPISSATRAKLSLTSTATRSAATTRSTSATATATFWPATAAPLTAMAP